MLLSANNICKSYAGQTILDHIDLHVNLGEVVGLLGANGAGKSTTMQIISGCLAADDGDIYLNDANLLTEPEHYKAQLGFLPEQPPLYSDMHVDEYLCLAAKLRHIDTDKLQEAVDNTVARCNLDTVRHKRIKHLSKGYQQRVGIAQAIIHQPKLIILDEPTVGLDPVQLEETRELIAIMAKDSGIILSSHILQEVEACCDSVILIENGQVTLQEKLNNIDSLQNIFTGSRC